MRFTTTLAFAFATFASSALAHMELQDPPPFRSKFNKAVQNPDFSMTSPLGVFPCKGYHVDFQDPTVGNPTAAWPAGSKQTIKLAGGAPQYGGSCQLSLSFDGGNTFKVVKSIEGGCANPDVNSAQSFDFTVPKDAKTGKAIFAWSWFNHTGNREMYMNCAAVDITNGADSTLADHPDIFKANIDGVQCTVPEGTDLQFPNPGDDVTVNPGAALGPAVGSGCDSSKSTDPTGPSDPTGPNNPTGSTDPTSDPTTPDTPSKTTSAPEPTASSPGTSYTVKSGDGCKAIAKANGITVADLHKLNPSINKLCTNLQPGQTLILHRRSRVMRDLN